MAKNLGTFTFAANFQVKAAEALDPRMVAASKADLITKENWPHDGDTIYVYKGLIVDCGADGVYRLIDPAKALATDYSGWERIDVGGVKIDNIFTYKHSVSSYDQLPVINVVGDVYNVEAAFSLGEGENKKDYPAGTNVAWNGEGWDPLAGSIDLSAYATKVEVAEVRASANTNASNIQNLSTALGEANAEIAKKVDAVEGSSLIPADKLALIDTNAGQISQLVATDESLTGRVEALESLFKDSGSGGTIDLGTINSQIADHGTRITSLETAVGTNTQAIGEIRNSINGLAVKSVKEGDLVLATDSNGVLNTTININHYKDESDGKTYIILTGIEGAVISRFDASDFVKDSFVDTVVYDPDTKNITITWNTESGKQPTVIPMSGLVDTYTAGTGLTVANNEFSVLLSANENNKLTVTNDGLLVDISEDLTALETKLNGNIASAFEWVNVE